MHQVPRASSTAKAVASCAIMLLSSPAVAEMPPLVDAFEKANSPPAEAPYSVSFDIDGCNFQRTIVNTNYCKLSGQGEGDRTVTTRIDLREVQAISTSEVRGDFTISFKLDFGGPGADFILLDRAKNGMDGAFDRYREQRANVLDAAELHSGKFFSTCDGSTPSMQTESSLAVVNDLEPEGWTRLIALARECRAPKPVKFSE
ncbi:hypothetical protein [Roseovarius nanhaiticus]|uniref:hypothetical protein n=1 Tax=Roseovarius nanhaiticus TaxID=573024 RepID=UPI002491AEBA|nr:hypothetical protein [Roseovarius nanhaiticus]